MAYIQTIQQDENKKRIIKFKILSTILLFLLILERFWWLNADSLIGRCNTAISNYKFVSFFKIEDTQSLLEWILKYGYYWNKKREYYWV